MKHPERVGKYEISRVLGQGGMGTVFEARDSVINRKVAVKMMIHGLAENPDLRERFMREAQSAGGLRHRNIVTIYDFGADDEGRPFIAMEFIEGTDLERIIQHREPHSIEWKLDVIRQICEGLAFAHRAGIVHRDVKPANIRVAPDGEVKLMDFGIARLESSNLTKSGLVLGSAHYMAPEQINGQRADHRSDLFSVGAIAFELLAGRKPFEADSLTAVLFKVTHDRPNAEALPRTDYSPGLERVILKALATNPEERYQTLDAMHDDLERVVREAAPRLRARTEPPADPVEALRKRVEHEMAERRTEIARARAEGQLQKALALCQKLLEMEPDDPSVQREAAEIKAAIQDREVEQLLTMAESYLAEGDSGLAEKIIAKAARLAPDSARVTTLRARLDAEHHRGSAATLLESAREHLVHGNLQEARAAAEESLAAEPSNASAREILETVSKVLAVREQAAPAMVEPEPVAPTAAVPPAPAPPVHEELFFDEEGSAPPTPIPVAAAPEPEPLPMPQPAKPSMPPPAAPPAPPAPPLVALAAPPPPLPAALAPPAAPPAAVAPAPAMPAAPVAAAPIQRGVPPAAPPVAPAPPPSPPVHPLLFNVAPAPAPAPTSGAVAVPPPPVMPPAAPPARPAAPPLPAPPAPTAAARPTLEAPAPPAPAAASPPRAAVPAAPSPGRLTPPGIPAVAVAKPAAPATSLAAPAPVRPMATPAAPTPPAAVSATSAAGSGAGSGDRKAEAAALATAAMNHFVASNNAKARKSAERALELDPANKKAKDLLKIMGLS